MTHGTKEEERAENRVYTHGTHLSIDPITAVSNPVGPSEEAEGLNIVLYYRRHLSKAEKTSHTIKGQERLHPFWEKTDPTG